MIIRSIKILLLFVVSFGSLQAQNFGFRFEDETEKKVRLPFTEYNNLIIIPLTINGQKMRFILDSGVKYNIIVQKDYANLLGLKLERTINLIGADRKFEMIGHVSNNIDVRMSGVFNDKASMVVLEEDYLQFQEFFGADVQGILGYELFRKFVVHINYDSHYVTFYNQNSFKPKSNYTEHDLDINFSKAYLNMNVGIGDEDIPVRLLLDTGASFSVLLDTETDEKINLPSKTIEGNMGRALGGSMSGKIGRIDELELGKYKFDDVVGFYQTDTMFKSIIQVTKRQGIVGGGVLSRFKVVIDYENGKLYLKKGKRYKRPFLYNRSGIIISEKVMPLPIYEIEDVIKGSPADIAGLQKDDLIMRINQTSGKDLTLGVLKEYLKSKAGRTLHLYIMRNGILLKKEVVLKEMI